MSLAEIGYGLAALGGGRTDKGRLEEVERDIASGLRALADSTEGAGEIDEANEDRWVARALTSSLFGVGVLRLSYQLHAEGEHAPTWLRFRRRLDQVRSAELDCNDPLLYLALARKSLYVAIYNCWDANLMDAYEELAQAREFLIAAPQHRSALSGRKGGRKPNEWALAVAQWLVAKFPREKGQAAWQRIPDTANEAVEVELDQLDLRVYRDGNRLVAEDLYRPTHQSCVGTLAESSFLKYYLRPAQRDG